MAGPLVRADRRRARLAPRRTRRHLEGVVWIRVPRTASRNLPTQAPLPALRRDCPPRRVRKRCRPASQAQDGDSRCRRTSLRSPHHHHHPDTELGTRMRNKNDNSPTRKAARLAVRRGWPVTPATFPDPTSPPVTDGAACTWQGFPGAACLQPVLPTWWRRPLWTPAAIDSCWSTVPYGVLLVCGHGIDALELPASTLDRITDVIPEIVRSYPVIALPQGRRIILTSGTNPRLHDELPEGCRWRAGAGWVPLPPTLTSPSASVIWKNPPDERLALPEPADLLQAIVEDNQPGRAAATPSSAAVEANA